MRTFERVAGDSFQKRVGLLRRGNRGYAVRAFRRADKFGCVGRDSPFAQKKLEQRPDSGELSANRDRVEAAPIEAAEPLAKLQRIDLRGRLRDDAEIVRELREVGGIVSQRVRRRVGLTQTVEVTVDCLG
jgi:hypothetical protein